MQQYDCQNIDRLIQGIKSIVENRFSLSDEDVKILNECIELFESLKRTNSIKKKRDILSKALGMLLRFYRDDIHDLLSNF